MIPRLYSDLHREFDGWDIPVIEGEQDMTLILAGDIAVAHKHSTWDILREWAERHAHVVYVPGNHEYYGDSFERAWDKIALDWEVDNLHKLQNGAMVVIDDVMITGATLWTDMDKQNAAVMYEAAMRMSDYRVINRLSETDSEDGWMYRGKLKPHHTIATHYEHKEQIDTALFLANQRDQKSLVVTHHGPTLQSVSPRYIGDRLNAAYVSDLSELIRERAPTAWVHGHVHDSMIYVEGQTQVVTNPKGYPDRHWKKGYENENFREDGLVPELVELFS